MYPGDARERWRDTFLTDSRVRHYWDDRRAIGQLYLQFLPMIWPKRSADTTLSDADALWDAYLLYAADAEWADQPPGVVSWGSPIYRSTDALIEELARTARR
jgi:hypothetical protein